MSKLADNIKKLEDSIYGLNFDISKQFLPDDSILKNLLRAKNPGMSKEQVDSMVDGDSGRSPLTKDHPLYDEVKKLKKEIREAVMKVIKGQKDLAIEVVNAGTLLINSIPGIAIQVTAPPFNVPNAISTVNVVTSSLMGVIAKITDTVLYLGPLSSLNIVLPEAGFESIVAPINAAVTGLSTLLTPISKIQEFIQTLTEKIKSLTKNTGKQVKSLTKDLDKKVQEKKDAENKKESPERTELLNDLNEEIEDIKNQIENLKNPKT